jgi:hypothetical protein
MDLLAINKIGDRLGEEAMSKKLKAWMHPCQVQAYEELGMLASVINKEAKEEGLNMYFNENMQLAGAPVKKHFSWDKTRIDFLVMDYIKRAEFHPCGFMKDANGLTKFQLRGASGGMGAGAITYIVASWNMYVEIPAAMSYISSLTTPSGY